MPKNNFCLQNRWWKCLSKGPKVELRGEKLAEEHKEILHYFWNKSFPDFGHFRIRKSDRKTVPSSSVIKVWQRERIQDTFETSGRANLERKSAWELFSWRWSSSKILHHGGRGCRSRLTICQLIQFYTNSDVALLSRQDHWIHCKAFHFQKLQYFVLEKGETVLIKYKRCLQILICGI